VKDPEFLAEVAKLNFDLDPLAGAALQDFFVQADIRLLWSSARAPSPNSPSVEQHRA